jgi:hypothetical protein
MFNIENHYGAHLKKETIRSESFPFILANREFSKEQKPSFPAIKITERSKIKYTDFLKMNKMFTEYLTRLKGTINSAMFANKIYTAELTGAKVKISDGRSGIVVEERANSLVIVFENDLIKTFIKRTNSFSVEHDGIYYIFVGSGMKPNRFTKK